MGIFRRKKDEPQPAEDGHETENVDSEHVDSDVDAAQDDDSDVDTVQDDSDLDTAQDDVPTNRLPRPHDLDRSNGPFDSTETEAPVEGQLDLGALILTPFADSELRLDVDEAGQSITGATAIAGDSAVQLQVFAAPKSSGLWDDIRDEIADNLIEAGGSAEEKLGELGIELHARMPARGQDGRTTYSPVRFIGVDGPRWFLRGVLSGKAAVEDDAATQLIDFARSAVIVRGSEARAPRELLELTIPAELIEQAPQQPEGVDDGPASAQDFKPFERGPEITEVR